MVLSYNVDLEEQVYKRVKATVHREVEDEELYEIAVEDDILRVT